MNTFKRTREIIITRLLKERKTVKTQKEALRIQQELKALGYFDNLKNG
jgi:hypothetical protein